MNEITCKNCGKTVQKRKGSQFCSTKCKNAYWNKQRGKVESKLSKNEEINISSEKETEIVPPKTIKKTFQVENPEYLKVKWELDQLKRNKDAYISTIKQQKQKVETLKKTNLNVFKLAGAAFGGYSGRLLNETKPYVGAITGSVLGAIGGAFYSNMIKKELPKDISKLLNSINENIQKTKLINSKIDDLQKNDLALPRLIPKEIEDLNPEYINYQHRQHEKLKVLELKQRRIKEEKDRKENERKQKIEALESAHTANETKQVCKIISSAELSGLSFEILDFQGKWGDFLGQPAVDFYMVIHGRAGGGKSTFTIQFATYLSVKFGDVLYVSGEEGFSKTLQQKLTNEDNENLYFADLHSFQDIVDEVPVGRYKFIVLDSLNNMKIDADGLQTLRKKYPDAATIAIAQSTKEGKMRGSNEIIHDCDIEISISEGIATTVKNRYKETGLTHKIF